MRRGEIRWCQLRAPDKKRPVLILTRDVIVDQMNEIIVAPVTRTIRGIATEVVLDEADAIKVRSALNLDHLGIVQRGRLGPVLCVLRDSRWPEVEHALRVACGFIAPA